MRIKKQWIEMASVNNQLNVPEYTVSSSKYMRSMMKKTKNRKGVALLCAALTIFSTHTLFSTRTIAESGHNLPTLGDASSLIITPEQEQALGRAWLKSIRSQIPIIYDPIVNDYLENIIYQLGASSKIEHREFEILFINNAQINAFAAPGGIIGINAGLFIHAASEDELAAVLAHELAHLSQRHFARNLEKGKRSETASLAALLASIALLITAGGETGLAALATTQALSMQSSLAFSRQNEQEADRIGMQTLAEAHFNPNAMALFFEKMQKISELSGQTPPEFLLTHPVTESRVSDSKSRANQYKNVRTYSSEPNIDFLLMKARMSASYNKESNLNISRFKASIENATSHDKTPQQYGLAWAFFKANKYDDALTELAKIRATFPEKLTFVTAEAEVLLAKEQFKQAEILLEKHLAFNPDSFALDFYLIKATTAQKKHLKAIERLEKWTVKKPNHPLLWQLLADARSQIGDKIGAYTARAELYFLNNQIELALEQLKFAHATAKNSYEEQAKIELRAKEILAYKKNQLL